MKPKKPKVRIKGKRKTNAIGHHLDTFRTSAGDLEVLELPEVQLRSGTTRDVRLQLTQGWGALEHRWLTLNKADLDKLLPILQEWHAKQPTT